MNNRIGLIDIDSFNFPNVALMKISAFHKNKGDIVEFALPIGIYDCVYASKVFLFSKDIQYYPRTENLIKGGLGYDIYSKLPPEIEKQYPDYSLYGIKDTAYGHITRGCPRSCSFCYVSKMEGRKTVIVADVEQFWRGQKYIKLLDANLLACRERIKILERLSQIPARIDFNQGLDVRLIDDDVIKLLNKIKIKLIHFAWDREDDGELVLDKLTMVRNKLTSVRPPDTIVYVLCNYNTTYEYDLYRVIKIKELGFLPYIMIYNRKSASRELKQFANFVNNKKMRIIKDINEYELICRKILFQK